MGLSGESFVGRLAALHAARPLVFILVASRPLRLGGRQRARAEPRHRRAPAITAERIEEAKAKTSGVALPIAIGVGSDYATSVMKRREIEGDEGIEKGFTETGGAVIACFMTTLCGYAALLFSMNGAVRSLGFAAGLGELATQLSAMLVLPAALYWMTMRRLRAPVVSSPGS